jgi:hypothetical protein
MSRAFDEVKTVLARIGGAWETLIPRLDAARRSLADTTALAQELGESGRADLGSVTRTLAELSAAITADPLSVAPLDVDRLSESLASIRSDLDATAALMRELDPRIAEARALLQQLRTAVLDGRAAHEEVTVKISRPEAPEPLELGDDLDGRLAEIAELARSGNWREARRALEQLTARVSALLADGRGILAANRAPIEARNQFRSLLEAYQVKAQRLGMVEDPRLAEIFSQAREALYNAPTDLALVGQLVRRYQEALSIQQPARETMR